MRLFEDLYLSYCRSVMFAWLAYGSLPIACFVDSVSDVVSFCLKEISILCANIFPSVYF